MAMWNSKAVQEKLGKGWIFDGNKLAWLVDLSVHLHYTRVTC